MALILLQFTVALHCSEAANPRVARFSPISSEKENEFHIFSVLRTACARGSLLVPVNSSAGRNGSRSADLRR